MSQAGDDRQPPKPRPARLSAAADPTLPLEDRPTGALFPPPAGGEAAAQAPFLAAQILADRYRIVRFIAQGGMGEVYEAEDLELRERVALKTIRPDIAQDIQALERFKREIQLARKIAHPSVSRVFDLGLHRPPGAGTPVAFFTMELLSGETLSERLRRGGRMSPGEALPVVEQMADALAAAHKAGIVHRDFKSANVMLVPGSEGARVVVTDFGLARAVVAGEGSPRQTGAIVGTADYMAPEQVQGSDLTPATDIYALGVVVYEMITGAKPFTGGSPLSTAVKRLVEPPAPPRSVLPDIDPKWEAAILRCLERHPADRFAGAADVARALRGEEVPAGRRTRRLRLLGVAAVLLASLGTGVVVSRLGSPPAPASAPAKPRRSVAVLGFKNVSGRPEAAWLSTAFSEMLTTELAAGGKLRTVPGENIGRMKIELSLSEAESLAADTLAKVGKNLSTDMVLLGSYTLLPGGQVRLDLRLQDVAAGETLVAMAENGTEASLVDLVSHAGTRLRQAVGIGEPSDAAAAGAKAGLPASLEAQRLYAEGLAKLRVLDALGAKDLLVRAVAADTNAPMAHSALAEAWSRLGYDGKAKQEARNAFDLSGSLSREQRLSVEARYRETSGEWDKAIEIHRALFAFFPDDVDYGLRLAAALTSAGQGKEALGTLSRVRKLQVPASADPRIDLGEADAAYSFGDFKQEQVAASRAASRGTAQGERLLAARARVLEAYALRQLGEHVKATAAGEEARRIYAESGDRGGVAWALKQTGDVYFWGRGDLEGAKKLFREALAIFRDIGDNRGAAEALSKVAAVSVHQGQLAMAKRLWEDALAIDREIGSKRDAAINLDNLAEAAYDLGQLAESRRSYEEALAICREIGERSLPADVHLGLGRMSAARGDLQRARSEYAAALQASLASGARRFSALALFGWGDLLLAEGDLAGARRQHEEALALRKELGDRFLGAESQVALANLSIEEGRPGAAEGLARGAAEVFAQENARHKEALAQAVVAQALLREGKLAEAHAAGGRAKVLSAGVENVHVRLAVATTWAGILGANGRTTEAVESLEATLAEATRLGLVGAQLEARLALARVDRRSGQAALAALAADARAKGFGLIARKAAASPGA